MVNTLQNFWVKHKKFIILGAIIILAAFLLPHIVHAADPAPVPDSSAPDNTLTDLLSGMSKVQKFLQRILWPVIALIGSLMQNDLLFGSGMEQRLNGIWVNIRNIVNILFVLILLGIALYNVVAPPGEGNYHFKTILPKFVIALIAVNFTFIGIKIALDGVNILSTAIFALPLNVECTLRGGSQNATGCTVPDPDTTKTVGLFTVEQADNMCGAIYGGLKLSDTTDKAQYDKNITNAGGQAWCGVDKDSTTGSYLKKEASQYFSQLNAKNAALVMAISLTRIDLLGDVYIDPSSASASNLALNLMFSILLYVVYAVAFVALFVALLVRLVALWVMIAISPLMVLPMVLPESLKSKLGEGGDLQKKFIGNAIMPIPVALVLSIGFVMLRGLQKAAFTSAGPSVNSLMSSNNISLNLLTSGLSSLQELIIAFGTVMFIWVGVFEAFKGTYAEQITNSIKSGVEGFGKAAGKFVVGSVPLFPTGKFDKQGKPVMANISDIGIAMRSAIPSMMTEKEQKHFKEVFPELGTQSEAISKVGQSKTWDDLNKNMGAVQRSSWKDKQFQNGVQTALKDPGSKEKMKQVLTSIGYTGGIDKFMKDLEAGNVSEADWEKIYGQMGIKPGSASAGAVPAKGQVEGDQQKKAMQNKYATANRGKLRKDGSLDGLTGTNGQPLDTSEKRFQDIEKRLKDPKTAEQAQKDLKEIDDAIAARDAATAALGASLKDNLNVNTGSGSKVKGGKVTKDNANDVNAMLEKKISDMSGGAAKDSPAYAAAKKKVMDAFGAQLDKQQADALGPLAEEGSLLQEAVKAKQAGPAKPGAPGAKAVGGSAAVIPLPPPPIQKPGGAGVKPAAPPPKVAPPKVDNGGGGGNPPPQPQPQMPAGGPQVASINQTTKVKGVDGTDYVGDGLGGWVKAQ